MNIMHHMRLLGSIAIFISAFTWGLELTHWVAPCPYCQTQRTMIGLLGILMFLPDYRYVSQFLAATLGLFGIHVASAQIFMNVSARTFDNIFFILATCALCIMVGQMLMLIARAYQNKV
jgi:hypothetical protein